MADGILEQIAADVAEIKSMLASGAGAAPAEEKKPAGRQKAAKPDFTAEQLRDKFLEVQSKHGDAVAKQLISDCGYDKLAKLIADTKTWQASWDAAEAKLAEEPDDDGGL